MTETPRRPRGRPRKPEGAMPKITTHVDAATIQRLQTLADRHATSTAALVRRAVGLLLAAQLTAE